MTGEQNAVAYRRVERARLSPPVRFLARTWSGERSFAVDATFTTARLRETGAEQHRELFANSTGGPPFSDAKAPPSAVRAAVANELLFPKLMNELSDLTSAPTGAESLLLFFLILDQVGEEQLDRSNLYWEPDRRLEELYQKTFDTRYSLRSGTKKLAEDGVLFTFAAAHRFVDVYHGQRQSRVNGWGRLAVDAISCTSRIVGARESGYHAISEFFARHALVFRELLSLIDDRNHDKRVATELRQAGPLGILF